MKLSNHQLSRHGRMLLVLMLVVTSFLPGSLRAFAMTGSPVAYGGGHHAVMGHISGDQSVEAHHLTQDVSAGSTQEPTPAGSDKMIDRCCPATCFVAICAFEPEMVDLIVPDSFENDPMLAFFIVTMALPKRPPRV